MGFRWSLITIFLAFGPWETARRSVTITTYAGTGRPGYTGDGGPAQRACLNNPFDLTFDRAGNLVFSDTMNHVVRRIDRNTGTISTIAGNGGPGFSGDGGLAVSAGLNEPYGIVFDAENNLYIADRLNRRVRRVDAKSGLITTFAGNGGKTFDGDGGLASSASLVEPNGLAIDPQRGRLYIADVSDNRVRSVDLKSGIISTFAGNGKARVGGERMPALETPIQGARAVKSVNDGTVYVVERQGNRVRAYDRETGTVSTLAGKGSKGFSVEPRPPLEAQFNGPKELAVEPDGRLLIVDTENHAVRRIDVKSGMVTTVAGDGRKGDRGDGGPPIKARLNRPHGVVAAPDGTIFIGDSENHRIRVIKLGP